MSKLKRFARRLYSVLYRACQWLASLEADRELARRDSARGQGKYHWLTEEESSVAGELAKIIVPSDEETPGLDDIDVLGPSAVEMLDKLLHSDSGKQKIYARGLLAFESWASRKHGRRFSQLDVTDQSAMFREAQQYSEKLQSGSKAIQAWRSLSGVMRAADGRFFAAQLYPEIRKDFLQVFYTSRVSWVWLEYDGPPMDEGYPRLARRR